MSTNDSHIVNLRQVERDDAHLHFHLNDAFFSALEQDEILGGSVEVDVVVRFGAADTFTFSYTLSGQVSVPCDRCLDPVLLSVEVNDRLKVAYRDNDEAIDADLTVIPYSQLNYDMAWDIYELLLLNLPLQRIHSSGECNADMLSRFSIEEDSDSGEFDV